MFRKLLGAACGIGLAALGIDMLHSQRSTIIELMLGGTLVAIGPTIAILALLLLKDDGVKPYGLSERDFPRTHAPDQQRARVTRSELELLYATLVNDSYPSTLALTGAEHLLMRRVGVEAYEDALRELRCTRIRNLRAPKSA